MTGVTGLPELAVAGPELRPTYLSADLEGLFLPHPAPDRGGSGWRCGSWRATVAEGRLEVSGDGSADDWWRAVAAALWDHLDRSGSAADVGGAAAPNPVSGTDQGNLGA
jgi:glycerol-1-phosphatase